MTVEMLNGTTLIAEADFIFFVQDSRTLKSNSFEPDKMHVLYQHQSKSTARLIVGLRALEQEKKEEERLFVDEHSINVAGIHGRLLANRFLESSPQLQPMVASRTRHLDDALKRFLDETSTQIVSIGAGFDCRPWRLPCDKSTWFELDLPLLLEERKKLKLSRVFGIRPTIVQVPIDLEIHDIHATLLNRGNFKPELPTFFYWEGGSMYFDNACSSRILKSIRELMKHPRSRFWLDYVDQKVIDDATNIPEVEAFISGMQRMGAPFINGYSDITDELAKYNFAVEDEVSSNIYIDSDDSVFDIYRFCLAKA